MKEDRSPFYVTTPGGRGTGTESGETGKEEMSGKICSGSIGCELNRFCLRASGVLETCTVKETSLPRKGLKSGRWWEDVWYVQSHL